MAEAFLRKYSGDSFEVYSAGLEPEAIHPLTLQVMEEEGIDMDGHYAKSLDQYMMKVHFGYMITLCERAEQKCPIFPGMGQRLYWPFEYPDTPNEPPDEKLGKFRQVRDRIENRVLAWLNEQEISIDGESLEKV
jgi:arsenate reductase